MPSDQPNPCRIVRHVGLAGLQQLEAPWLSLLASSGRSFTNHPAWYQAQLQCCEAAPDTVVFFALYQGEQLVAVLPLQRRRKSLAERFGIPFSYLCWELYYPSDMLWRDPLFQMPQVDLGPLVAALRQEGGWDTLELLHLPLSSGLAQHLLRQPPFFTKPSHTSRYLPNGLDDPDNTARYSKKLQHELRRKLRNLQKLGNYRFEYVTAPAELAKAFQAFLSVEDSGWKAKSGTAIAEKAHELHYYQALLAGFGDTGHLAIHLLWLDQRCIAGQFMVEIGSNLELLKIGYDEEFAAVSPGMLLIDHLLQLTSARPAIKRISFVTDLNWMKVWKPLAEPIINGYYFNHTVKGVVLSLAMRLFKWLKPLFKRSSA